MGVQNEHSSSMDFVTGHLEVVLVNADGLKDVEIFGDQDPYCILLCGGKSFRSATHQGGGRTPVWNERFFFSDVSANMSLHCLLVNQNILLPDDPIGHCEIRLHLAAKRSSADHSFPIITGKDKAGHIIIQGTLHLILNFISGSTGDWIFPQHVKSNIKDFLKLGHVVSRDHFGAEHVAVDRRTSEKVLVKVVPKKTLTKEMGDKLRRQVHILNQLRGVPHVLHLKDDGVLEDSDNIYMVKEYYKGGKLLDVIAKKTKFHEKDAAVLIRSLAVIIKHLHSMNIVHRHICSNSLILCNEGSKEVLKIADFSYATFIKKGDQFTEHIPTTAYSAPEVLKRSYGKECDIWSCGAVMHALLCGAPPFAGLRESSLKKKIMSQPLDFTSRTFSHVSSHARELLCSMLERNPETRATAKDVLNHKWMKRIGVAADNPVVEVVLQRMQTYAAMSKLKKMILVTAAREVDTSELVGLSEMFADMDHDEGGTISFAEFKEAMRDRDCTMRTEELRKLYQSLDMNEDGLVSYAEFLASMLNHGPVLKRDVLERIFGRFDLDHDGLLSREELNAIVREEKSEVVEQVLSVYDRNGDGRISLSEFVAFMTR